MAVFKLGYDRKPLHIRVEARDGVRATAELWVEQFDGVKYTEYGSEGEDRGDPKFRTETLAYVSIDELLQLRDEINETLKEMIGV